MFKICHNFQARLGGHLALSGCLGWKAGMDSSLSRTASVGGIIHFNLRGLGVGLSSQELGKTGGLLSFSA